MLSPKIGLTNGNEPLSAAGTVMAHSNRSARTHRGVVRMRCSMKYCPGLCNKVHTKWVRVSVLGENAWRVLIFPGSFSLRTSASSAVFLDTRETNQRTMTDGSATQDLIEKRNG